MSPWNFQKAKTQVVLNQARIRRELGIPSFYIRAPLDTERRNGDITIDANDYISISKAGRMAPGNPSPTAVWRWCRKGLKARNGNRIHLKHIRAGKRIYTKIEWINEFCTTLAEADIESLRPQETNYVRRPRRRRKPDLQRQRELDRINKYLDSQGL